MTVGDAQLASEAARRRRELREEQEGHARTRAALRGANGLLLRAFLRERLQTPEDFEIYVGASAVLDDVGRIDWEAVDLRLSELLAARPYLATPTSDTADGHRPSSAVHWVLTR